MSNREYSLFNPMIDFELTDIDAVKKSIYLILMTNRGERLMQPRIGTGLRNLVFEPLESITEIVLKDKIRESIELALPIVEIDNLELKKYPKKNIVDLYIEFRLQTTKAKGQIELQIPWKV